MLDNGEHLWHYLEELRDARFLASINSELINSIIDTEIEFFKLIVESSNSNIYGESESKAFMILF
jgi:hypothetical protein